MADTYINISIVKSNGIYFDLSKYIQKDSISISAEPRTSSIVRTMDGVDHVSGGGIRQTLRFTFNPMTADKAKDMITELFHAPALGIKFNGFTTPANGDYYEMRLSEASSSYLASCKFAGQNWFQFEELELIEL